MTPIKYKPSTTYKYPDFIQEIPNVLNDEQISRLINYTTNENSGIHRRGSKQSHIDSSFYTCQIHPLSDEIYSQLNYLWEPYTNIDFIEPYELKKYVEGDLFEYHTDIYINLYEGLDRKINLIIQLSDPSDYVGGDLMINEYTCSREKGSAVIFPACLFHAVTKITSGTRHSLIGHGWGQYKI